MYQGESAALHMDDASFEKLSRYIIANYGIKLPPSKRSMLESRLNKKVRTLGLTSYTEFIDYIFSDKGKKDELWRVVDLITTNKTDFFREPSHFQFLSDIYLPAYMQQKGLRNLKVWSAGCSTGEEPYSLVMLFEEFRKQYAAFNYSILASDISVRAIQAAHQGIYRAERTSVIPSAWKRSYLLKSKDDNSSLVRVKPMFRNKITYRRINLIEPTDSALQGTHDLIFCRNVLIYFDRVVQRMLSENL